MHLQALNCPNCGAPLGQHYGGEVLRCQYCNTTFSVPKTLTPQPDMGPLVLGADFSRLPVPGWEVINPKEVSVKNIGFPVLDGYFPARNLIHYTLTSGGWFDDFDASVSLRFTKGPYTYIRGGMVFRYNKEKGGYIFFISPQQSYTLAYYALNDKKELEWYDIQNWTTQTALKEGMDVDNRLRIVMKGSRLRVYVNGVLAMSITDEKFRQGQIRLALGSGKDYDCGGQFSDLQIREALD